MENNCLLLDTSFFIRLLNVEDPLHLNVFGYYKYFLENRFVLKISTISIAEYCVRGKIDELPLQELQIIPFNINHAETAGKFAFNIFKDRETLSLSDRKIIPNDSKLFAQAHVDEAVQKFATSDGECIKVFNHLNDIEKLKFDILNIRIPYSGALGILDLK